MSKKIGFAVSTLLLSAAWTGRAQIRTGDFSNTLSGNVSAGYTGNYGNFTGSDHSFTLGGSAELNGSFYNPNFLSYSIQPFYNQSRANSDFQSITDSSGINASTSIFGGSSFPGSVSYSKIYDSSGTFGVPGLANFTSHGNSDTFSAGWSENLPDLPHLSVGYQQGSNDYSIYGADARGSAAFKTFDANLNYGLAGFTFTGGFRYLINHFLVPQFVQNESPPESSKSNSTGYSFGVSHALPFGGSFSASASRSDLNAESTAGPYTATIDTVSVGASFNPIDHLHVGSNAQYLDDLTGSIYASIVAAGGIVGQNLSEMSSHSLDITSYANYDIPALHLIFGATEEHRDQRYFGESLSSDAATGTGTYANALLGGFLNATAGITRTALSSQNQRTLGYFGLVNYSRPIGKWNVAGSLNYAQNQETLLISYTTSGYGYTGNLSRKFSRRSIWTLVGSGTKSGLSEHQGTSSFTQGYTTALNMKWVSASASYAKSSGNSILTPSGLAAPSTLLPVLTPTAIVLYGGYSYAFGLSTTPLHGLTLSGSYSNALTNTQQDGLSSSRNSSQQVYTRIQYLVRKVYLQAGYTRLVQGFSASGNGPAMANSFYFGLARWFNFF